MHGKRTPGIDVRHSRSCGTRDGANCNCRPAYQAHVWSAREKRRIRKTFNTITEAKRWRQDAIVGVRRGTMRAPTQVTLRLAAESWLSGAKDGTIRNRSGDAWKPSTLRGYEAALKDKILVELGPHRLSDIRRVDVQDFADRMLAGGADPSTIRNTLMPLRVIYRRALSRGEVAVNPTTGIELPAVRGRRERIATPEEAAKLLAALPKNEQPLWATAFYTGLRRGELMGLRWSDLDLDAGLVWVRRSMDERAGEVAPKSAAGTRKVPIPAVLSPVLKEHYLASGRPTDSFVFSGGSATAPFTPSAVRRRAITAWAAANKAELEKADQENRKPALLEPIALHECRHTYASLMIAAGVGAKALSTYMGHANVSITLDRYGHLMPGNEEEAASLLDAYLARSTVATAEEG
jgi:integrase